MNPLRIIFMGTPEFAVPSLEILVENKFNVVAVVTAPDKPQGRGKTLQGSPVKECALKHDIAVLQPPNLKATAFLEELRNHKADLQVVVAFRMLPEVVWAMPGLGTFNLHASLLPQYRGAAPINWALINGEMETGVTTFFLRQEIDTGKVIFQEKEVITADDDAGALSGRLKKKGALLVLRTVQAIQSGTYPQIDQPTVSEIKSAPKIFKETCEINWVQPVHTVVNFVRGLSPYPAAWTTLQGKVYKIFKVSPAPTFAVPNPDTSMITDNKMYLYFRCTNGWIAIEELQPEGKKRMGIRDFFRGNKLG